MQDKINSITELMEGRPLNKDWTFDAKDYFYPDLRKKKRPLFLQKMEMNLGENILASTSMH